MEADAVRKAEGLGIGGRRPQQGGFAFQAKAAGVRAAQGHAQKGGPAAGAKFRHAAGTGLSRRAAPGGALAQRPRGEGRQQEGVQPETVGAFRLEESARERDSAGNGTLCPRRHRSAPFQLNRPWRRNSGREAGGVSSMRTKKL